jgi:hypothetical protein
VPKGGKESGLNALARDPIWAQAVFRASLLPAAVLAAGLWQQAFWRHVLRARFWMQTFWMQTFWMQTFWSLAFWTWRSEGGPFWTWAVANLGRCEPGPFWTWGVANLGVPQGDFESSHFKGLAFWRVAFESRSLAQAGVMKRGGLWAQAFWNVPFEGRRLKCGVWGQAFWTLAYPVANRDVRVGLRAALPGQRLNGGAFSSTRTEFARRAFVWPPVHLAGWNTGTTPPPTWISVARPSTMRSRMWIELGRPILLPCKLTSSIGSVSSTRRCCAT